MRLRAAARRRAVERSFVRAAPLQRLARDDERLPETLAGLHFVASATLILAKAIITFNLVRNTL